MGLVSSYYKGIIFEIFANKKSTKYFDRYFYFSFRINNSRTVYQMAVLRWGTQARRISCSCLELQPTLLLTYNALTPLSSC